MISEGALFMISNGIWLTVFVLTLLPIVINGLLGIKRGLWRSLLKLGLVGVAALIAYAIRGAVAGSVMDSGLSDTIRDALPENMESVADTIVPIVEIMVGIVVFLVFFLILNFIFNIVFIFLKKLLPVGEKKLLRLIGGIGVGVLAGVVFAICFVGPISGLIHDASVLADVEIPDDNGETKPLLEENEATDGLKAYGESGLAAMYNTKVTGVVYNSLATGTDKNGKEISLTVQINAVNSAIKMAVKVMAITDLKFDDGITTENVGDVTSLLRDLADIQGEMSEETKEAVTELITSVADSFDMPDEIKDTIKNFDLSTVDFNNEADLVDEVVKYQSQYEESGEIDVEDVDVDVMVEKLAKSELILPALSAIDNGDQPLVELNDEQKDEVQNALDNLPADTDPKKIEDIKALFGMN